MSQAYMDVVNRFIQLQEIMRDDDKEFKKNPKKTARIAAVLILASLFSKFSLDKQYAVWKAMKQTMSEKIDDKAFKTLGDSIDEIAATLIFASEVNKVMKK
ncbi:MAG: hypothetical protein ACFE9L_09760 [Candidatus Hodarchaeota archaeon]